MFSPISYITLKNQTYYLNDQSTIRQALEKLDQYKFSVVPIINEEGKFIGTVSEGDILRFIKNECNFDIKKAENTKVIDIEKYRPYKAIKVGSTFFDILSLSLEQNFIPLVDDRDMYIGIIKRSSLMNILYGERMDNVFLLKEGEKVSYKYFISLNTSPSDIYELLSFDNGRNVLLKYRGNGFWEKRNEKELFSQSTLNKKEVQLSVVKDLLKEFDK